MLRNVAGLRDALADTLFRGVVHCGGLSQRISFAVATSTGYSGSIMYSTAMRCYAIWCWPGSSSRPARPTRCGCSPRPVSTRRRIARSSDAYPSSPNPLSASHCRRPALDMPGWARRRWCSTTSTLYFETDAGDGFRELGFSNYAEVPVMPRSWWLWWCSCCSAGLAGWARAA